MFFPFLTWPSAGSSRDLRVRLLPVLAWLVVKAVQVEEAVPWPHAPEDGECTSRKRLRRRRPSGSPSPPLACPRHRAAPVASSARARTSMKRRRARRGGDAGGESLWRC